ncbi:MAG: nucleoside triphosphate pyrophosphohydrolase [Desulfobulbaceae bacterium]|nr:nucleoside triphosphate pyrophosphohydrolase [Desulfobulbaceae bacterium]
MSDIEERFSKLNAVIIRLRQPDGCPWDQKQTVATFRPYLVEELHELLEAIDSDDHPLIKEELGDLLFQVIFLSHLYEEKKLFTIGEVLDTITNKMINRHPHVFGDVKITSEKELRRNWNRIKTTENVEKGDPARGIFSLPRSLPALQRAQRVSVRAVGSGFEWPDLDSVFLKLDEEIAELKEAILKGCRTGIEDEIGDVLFTMVNVARKSGYDAEASLQKATDKFIRRFNRMCEMALSDGTVIDNLDVNDMQRYWQVVKSEE